jgi:hypothetical protein
MTEPMTTQSAPRPPLRRLLIVALAGGLGVFGLGLEPPSTATQKASLSALSAPAAANERQPES